MKTLVTGWSGQLGRQLLSLLGTDQKPLVLAGRTSPGALPHNQTYLKFDMLDHRSVPDLTGVDVVYHLASRTPNFSREADVAGTRQLLKAAAVSGVQHFVYVSIVGIDKVPLKYYKIKLETENLVREGGIPFTILRATQFHPFFTWLISKWHKSVLPIILRDALFQPIAIESVAKALARMGQATPQNKTVEMGGPHVISLGEAMNFWMEIKKQRRFVLSLPSGLIGRIGRELRDGSLTTSSADSDSQSWKDWVNTNHMRF